MKKTTIVTNTIRPLARTLPHIDGIRAIERQQMWSGSPWRAFQTLSR